MSNQLHTLLELNIEMQNLDFAQELIDEARFAMWTSGELQRLLDRRQVELDKRRERLLAIYHAISSSN